MNPASSDPAAETWTRRRWIKQFALGSAIALGVGRGWRATLLADIYPGTPASDILPISLLDFPGLLDGSTPSVQLQLTVFQEAIMINRPPYGNDFYVLNPRCTHQGCRVDKWTSSENIYCQCHGSIYDVDGRVIHGAGGLLQPPLSAYNFSYDGANLLQIEVPGLNLKINGLSVESSTATNKRLRLAFPVYMGSDYRVTYSPDLQTEPVPVQFAMTAGGPADRSSIRALTTDPLNVWVDDSGTKGFYRIELILAEIF